MPDIDTCLDDLTDARAALKRYRDLTFRLGALVGVAVVVIFAGAVFANTALGVAAIIVGSVAATVVATALAIVMSTAWSSPYDGRRGDRHPARAVEQAEREYREALRREGR